MLLTRKIPIALLLAVLLYALLDYGIHRFVIFPGFRDLEENEAIKDLNRCVRALRREIHHLDLFTNDWATWDDTYHFIEDRNHDFIQSNLGHQTFIDNRLNVIVFCKLSGEVVWGASFDLETAEESNLGDFARQEFTASKVLLGHKTTESSVAGIYMTEKGPMLLASRPIVRSDRKGPIRGALIMGRLLTKEVVSSLVAQTQVNHQMLPLHSLAPNDDAQQFLNKITPDAPVLIKREKQWMQILTIFNDLSDSPVLLIRADVPRDIAAKGASTMQYAMYSNMALGLLFLIVLLFYFQRLIIRPISDLTRHVTDIRDGNDLSLRFGSQRRDELGLLANEFDRMVGQLQSTTLGLEAKVAKSTHEIRSSNRQLQKEMSVRIQAQAALRKANNELEQKVASRTAALIQSNAQLKHEVEERRQAEKELQSYHEKLRSLSSELLLTEELERRRIATDLHDRIGQALTMSKFNLDALIEPTADRTLRRQLEQIGELIDQTIQDTRQLTFELSPPILYELGLEPALEWLVEQFQTRHGLRITFEDDLKAKPLGNVCKVLIFQACRELLFNIVKHARAQSANLTVKRLGQRLKIEIFDDGVGFDASENNWKDSRLSGFGLFSIRERLHHLNGHLVIESSKGKGTLISLVSPLNHDR